MSTKKVLIFFFLPSCFLLLLFYLFLFPTQAFQAACSGLDLWFHTILPSLLPFCILSNLFIASGIIPKLLKPFASIFRVLFGLSVYGAYALFLGVLCGYPMGAKIVSDLYKEQKINQNEGNYLLTFVNHASPMFVTSYISLHLFGNTDSLPMTFFLLYSSAFVTCVLFRFFFHFTNRYTIRHHERYSKIMLSATSITDTNIFIPHSSDTNSYTPITIEMVDDAIFNGFETITKLGGYIILFSIFSSMIQNFCTPFPTLQWFLPCITELTTGIQQLMNTSLDLEMKYIMILTFTSFGGISTIAQTKGMLNSTPFKISTYILGKIVNAICTFILASVLTILV